MPKYSRFNDIRKQSPLGTRWLWFYTKILILLNIIVLCISLMVIFPQIMSMVRSADYSKSAKMMSIAGLVINGVWLWLYFKTYFGLLDFTAIGYKYNQVYLWAFAVKLITNELIRNHWSMPISRMPYMIIILLISALILIPNLIYFKKRKSLFGSAPSVDAELPA